VDPCYVSHTWAFLDSINSHIRFDPDNWLHPQRTSDTFIMEELTRIPGIKPIELVHAQRCRLHLGVTTMADISTSNGKTICGWALNGNDNPRPPIFRFPRQDKPSPAVWKTWRKALCLRYSPSNTGRLDQPLGRWHKGRITQVWDTVIDPTTSLIYMWIDRRVRIYEKKDAASNNTDTDTHTAVTHSHMDAYPSQVKYRQAISSYPDTLQPPRHHRPHPNF
jgi:hypothetical protein